MTEPLEGRHHTTNYDPDTGQPNRRKALENQGSRNITCQQAGITEQALTRRAYYHEPAAVVDGVDPIAGDLRRQLDTTTKDLEAALRTTQHVRATNRDLHARISALQDALTEARTELHQLRHLAATRPVHEVRPAATVVHLDGPFPGDDLEAAQWEAANRSAARFGFPPETFDEWHARHEAGQPRTR